MTSPALNWQHVVPPSGEMFSGLGFLFAWLLVIVLESVIAGIALGHRRSGSGALAGYAGIALAIAFEAVLAVVAGPRFNNPQSEGFVSAALLGAVVSALFYVPAAACSALIGGAARRTQPPSMCDRVPGPQAYGGRVDDAGSAGSPPGARPQGSGARSERPAGSAAMARSAIRRRAPVARPRGRGRLARRGGERVGPLRG